MSDHDERKEAAAAAEDSARFDQTEFGRRPVSRVPPALRWAWRMVSAPFRLVYRKLRRVSSGPPEGGAAG